MAEQPTGTVTLLFTDIEGSTALLQRLGTERYAEALDLHRRLLREAFDRYGGYEVDYEGDAFFVAFARASGAVAAAGEAQQALAAAEWPEGLPIRVRMGIHTGEPVAAPPKYVGLDVHKAARIMAAGHGGQVLVSVATQRLIDAKFEVMTLGAHRLKDLGRPEPLFQLRIDGLPDEFPALKTLGYRPNNLPVVVTPFVGRDHELETVRALLRREDVRLLTLTGPGGIGKTRLALQAAADELDSFRSGVFWVPLASVRDPALVVAAIAQALAVRELPGEPIIATLMRYLADKELLLVLDNFEHVVDAATDVGATLAAAANLRVVVTSREALRLDAEHLYDVPPLALPDADDPATIEVVDAVQLFLRRAQAVEPGFVVTRGNASVIAAIVRRLDGIPLALELAAARVRELSPEALLRRLDNSLHILSTGRRDADERQRTLRATIGWSYDLLPPDEQNVFARLGVFVGGCRLEAAEAVCGNDPPLASSVFEEITSLLHKSLVRRRDDPDGEPRYWMLESIQEFARDALGSDDGTQAALQHARYFAAIADGLDAAATAVVERDYTNFATAVDRALGDGDFSLALDLLLRMRTFWYASGRAREALSRFNAVLAQASDAPAAALATGYTAATQFAQVAGDYTTAREYGLHALQMWRELDEPVRESRVLSILAVVTPDVDPVEVLAHAADLAVQGGDPGAAAVARNNLAYALLRRAEVQTALQVAQESRREFIKIGGDDGAGFSSLICALAVFALGDPHAAFDEALHALDHFARSRNTEGELTAVEVVAAATRNRTLRAAAARLREELGLPADPVASNLLPSDDASEPASVDLTLDQLIAATQHTTNN